MPCALQWSQNGCHLQQNTPRMPPQVLQITGVWSWTHISNISNRHLKENKKATTDLWYSSSAVRISFQHRSEIKTRSGLQRRHFTAVTTLKACHSPYLLPTKKTICKSQPEYGRAVFYRCCSGNFHTKWNKTRKDFKNLLTEIITKPFSDPHLFHYFLTQLQINIFTTK